MLDSWPIPLWCIPRHNFFGTALKYHLDEGERVQADRGYAGDERVKAPGPLYTEDAYLKMSKKIASRHETVNKRFKIFQCLVHRFRHDVVKYTICFRAIAVITQLGIENGEPLFQVNYNDRDYV